MTHSPPTKRIKLESSPHLESGIALPVVEIDGHDEGEEADGEHCSICLQPYADRTMIPTCSHEFCFECLLIWTDQSRRCPLCSQDVGNYLMHSVRSKYDYQKHYLTPLRTSPQPQAIAVVRADARRRAERRREVEWGRRRRREVEQADELEQAIEKRRWVYRNKLYAKHVASNPYTRYRPFPTPAQFAASQDLISRATVFIRRELQVWVGLDVEFLTTFTVSLMKALDIRSEPAVRLLSEFLDMDAEDGRERANAEHFAHELYSYLRSPYRDLLAYDNNVQYDVPNTIPPPNALQRRQRWRSRSRSRSHSSSREVPSARSRRHPPTSRSTSRDSSSHSEHLSTLPLRSRHRRPESNHHPSEPQHPRRDHSRSRRSYRARSESRPSGTYCAEQRHDATGYTRSGRSRGSYNEKGKDRAEDVRAGGPSLPASRRDSVVAVGSSRYLTAIATPRHSSSSRASGENSPAASTLSTPYHASDLSAATQDVGTNIPAPLAVPCVPHGDTGRSTTYTPEDRGVASPSSQLDPIGPVRPPGRVRRNAWQTIQDHLASSGRDPRSSKPREGASAPERASSSKSQAPSTPASFPPDGALRPEHPSPADEAVPSLLLRLSDPVPTTSVSPSNASHNAPDGSPTSRRDALSASKGKGISAPEMTMRTRGGPLTQSPERADPSYASHVAPSHQPPGAAGRQLDIDYDAAAPGRAGDADAAGEVGPMSSGYTSGLPRANRAGRGAQPSHPPAGDPRFLLVQKLEVEKRKAAVGVPTAEKAQLSLSSSSATAGQGHDAGRVPMVLPPADVRREGLAKSAVPLPLPLPLPGAEGVAAGRQAERREAELRSQAQLRVRLAAAKRAAAALQMRDVDVGVGASGRADDGTGTGTRGTGPGSPPGPVSIDDGLMSHEIALRGKLKARMACLQSLDLY